MLGEGEETQWSLPLYSLMIMSAKDWRPLLRIVAYMVKNNHRTSLIRQSVIVALFASVITAVIFQLLFTNSPAENCWKA
jgi:high-affinity iron transporter